MLFDINEFIYDDFNVDFTNKIDILKELPYEVQFNKDDLYETFLNLYKYHENNNTTIYELPSPFFEDCIITEIENMLSTSELAPLALVPVATQDCRVT